MNGNDTALTFEELSSTRTATRVIRYLAVLALAVALPVVVVVATPLVGWVLLTAILFSPLIMAYVFFVAARQAEAERSRARA